MKLTTSSFILGLCTLPPPLAGMLALAKSFRLKKIKQESALKGYMYRGQKILVLFLQFRKVEVRQYVFIKHDGQCAILVSVKHFIDLTSDHGAWVEAAVLLAPVGCNSCSLRQVSHRGGLNVDNLYDVCRGRGRKKKGLFLHSERDTSI